MATTHQVTATTLVDAPVGLIWSLLCDTTRYAEWLESTIEVHSGDRVARLGSIYEERTRLSGFWTSKTRWEVVELRAPSVIALEGFGVPAVRRILVEFGVEPVEAGADVSSTYSYTLRYGLLGSVIEFGFKNNVNAEQRRSLRTLAILAEREAGTREC